MTSQSGLKVITGINHQFVYQDVYCTAIDLSHGTGDKQIMFKH